MAFRHPKSLQDYLVRAKLRPLDQNTSGNRGTCKCTSNICDVCNYLALRDSFSSHIKGSSYTVNHQLDCNSRNVVYLISCKVCGLQYVGSTTTKFRLRINNHKRRLRAHSKMSAANKDRDDTIYKHFLSAFPSSVVHTLGTGCQQPGYPGCPFTANVPVSVLRDS